nr:GFA family protein [Hydrogenovibrio sp. JE_KL2]
MVTTFNLLSTQHIKSFCSNCGSALPNMQMSGKLLVVPAGSLDTHLSIKPNAHIFTASKATWDSELEKVVMFEGAPA